MRPRNKGDIRKGVMKAHNEKEQNGEKFRKVEEELRKMERFYFLQHTKREDLAGQTKLWSYQRKKERNRLLEITTMIRGCSLTMTVAAMSCALLSCLVLLMI